MTYNQWDIAVIPFPFVDSAKAKPRPVLILSQPEFAQSTEHCLAAMITSAHHPSWMGDTQIMNLMPTGLNKPSLIRLKLFTLDLRFNPRIIGTLGPEDQKTFLSQWTNCLF